MPVSTVSPPTRAGRPPTTAATPPARAAVRHPARTGRSRPPPSDEDVHLIPGATIAGGRYRLLVFHGGPPHLQFWQALDTALDRQVALTFVDPDAALPDEELQEILARTLRLSRIERPGIARVLDVANTGSGGLVVSRVDPRRVAAGGRRDVAVADRRRPRHPVAGRGRRGRAPGRGRAVDRPSQPGPGQHRRRRRAGVPRDHAGRHARGRHPRHRRGAVRAAGQPLAAARVRRAQRDGACRRRRRGRARRTPRRRPRHPVPDLGRGRARRCRRAAASAPRPRC